MLSYTQQVVEIWQLPRDRHMYAFKCLIICSNACQLPSSLSSISVPSEYCKFSGNINPLPLQTVFSAAFLYHNSATLAMFLTVFLLYTSSSESASADA